MSFFGNFGNPRIDVFSQLYPCYSGAYCDKNFIDDGGKIILPPSALNQISHMNVVWPLMLKITNPVTGAHTHCGVLEFSAQEGKMFVPFWIMENLGIQPGSSAKCETASLRKGKFVKLRPRKKEFVETADPKVILERKLRDFSCLTHGDTIVIAYNDKRYEIDVMEVKDDTGPCEAISIVETDLNLEFERPLDMPESPVRQTPTANDSVAGSGEPQTEADMLFTAPIVPQKTKNPKKESEKDREKEQDAKSFRAFAGSGFRIDGKPIRSPSKISTGSTEKKSEKKKNKKPKSKEDYWNSLGSGRSLK